MTDISSRNCETYNTIVSTYITGLYRLNESELASHRLSVSVFEFNKFKADNKEYAIPSFLEQLERMKFSEWDAFNYVSNISHLVYATSLLDTFLNETTQFLLLLHPGALGKDVSMATKDVIAAKSPRDLLVQASLKKSREITYGDLSQRLAFLKDRFAINVSLSEETHEKLMHYTSVRNVAIHDQGFVELDYDENGEINFQRKTCPRHPTPVSIDDLREIYAANFEVVRQIAQSVLFDILHSEELESTQSIIKFLNDSNQSPAKVVDEGPA